MTPSLLAHTFNAPSRTFNNLSLNSVADFRAIPAATLQLSAASYTTGEAAGSLAIVVNRTDTTAAATINFATSDTAGLTPCSTFNGVASSRCDYATTVGTLRFAIGEASKTIFIPIIDDNFADGAETFTLILSNPSGATLGTSTATITINDNDATTSGNPIDQTLFFVHEQYIDFLRREPDLAKVSGFLSAQQLEDNKAAFVNEFMTRSDFQTLYGALTDPNAYVTALLTTVALPNHPNKQTWVNALTNGTMTRGQVLRALVESTEVYQKYYNEAFVIMQYFGYLRRSADGSYVNWIQTMNSTNGDYRTMINGFLNSPEYRQRFGN